MNEIIFTAEERRTILYVLSEIMLADGYIHGKEQELYDRIFNQLNANVSDLDTMEYIDDSYARAVLNNLNVSQKDYLIHLFHDMALADNILDYREQKVLDNYSLV